MCRLEAIRPSASMAAMAAASPHLFRIPAAGRDYPCCAPWTIRNYFVFHRFIPLRSNFSFELWLGNNDAYDLHAPNTRTRITQYEEIRRYRQLGETQFMQEKRQKAIQFIRSHPQLEWQLTSRRFLATWIGLEYPLRDFFRSL